MEAYAVEGGLEPFAEMIATLEEQGDPNGN